MYLSRVQNIIKGYVCISIEGFYIEKIINICKKNCINLTNVKRKKTTLMYASIPVTEFKTVAKIVKKNNCRIKIEQKKGMPFLLHRYKKRKIFAISMICIVGLIIILSNFVWNIEVVGNEAISKEEILNITRECGLETGKLKSKINPNDIVEHIRLLRDDISWVGVKICGTNVRIEVVEADFAPKIINPEEYCSIVATKDCMIEKIYAQNGTLSVKEGDVVKKGTVLISGWLEGKYTGTRYVHATGKVLGKVWYSESSKVYFKQKVNNKTGKEEHKYSINLNKFKINLYKRLSKFQIYDTIRTEKRLKISSNFYLPIEVIETTNYELREDDIEYTKEEAKKQAIDKARESLKAKIGENEGIVNEYISAEEYDDCVEVKITYEVLENIGTEEKIAL